MVKFKKSSKDEGSDGSDLNAEQHRVGGDQPQFLDDTSMYPQATDKAREYYNSSDADRFYEMIWGGEDIHIGIYENDKDSIFDASRRTVAKIASLLVGLDAKTRVLDIGAGYGGSARCLVNTFNCQVGCLNLSEIQNKRNRELNRKQKISLALNVVDGSFEDIPLPDGAVDVVWSQDAILHSGDRTKVFQEVYRVLDRGGQFIFTDPMQSEDCSPDVLQPILDRIDLDSLGSVQFYRQTALQLGFKELQVLDLSEHLSVHYQRVLEDIDANYAELIQVCSDDYVQRMKLGLQHWIDGGKSGDLSWAILHFQKA